MDTYDDLFGNPVWDDYHPHHLGPDDRAFDDQCTLYSLSEWQTLLNKADVAHTTLGRATLAHTPPMWFLILDTGEVAAAIAPTPPCTSSMDWQSHGNHEAMMLANNLLDAIHGYRKPTTPYTTTEA